VETLNSHLEPAAAPLAPPAHPRVALKANTDLKKFYYKPLSMHQSEASEVLDDRIDEFTQIIAEHNSLDASAFGNAASKSTAEIVAVGRIASDSSEGKLNESSMVLELSRRQGAGLRVPLKFASNVSGEFFPGQIVGVRGTNASGEYFSVSEVLDVPLLPPAAALPTMIEEGNARLGLDDGSEASASHALSLIVASGPYTADDNLDYEPLHALCEQAAENSVDVLVLSGPFLDIEHPLIASGDFELPDSAPVEPDQATLSDAFRAFISEPLRQLAQAHPSITIVLVPSTRDAINKHTAYPQEPFAAVKKELGLPKQARPVTNPCTLSFNEVVLGISAQDVLNDLRREEVLRGTPSEGNLLARLPRHLVQQRHFYPLYPAGDRTTLPRPSDRKGAQATEDDHRAIGTPLDPTYLKLAEMLSVRPDLLIVPSALLPFAKVVDSVVAINPGPLSKRRGAGTFARIAIHPRTLDEKERAAPDRLVPSRVFERGRVDVVRI
jgi:DNA polymerase alpha subunit B